MCRVALCDNQHWLVVVTLFGLLGCNVAITLKKELLLTLAAVSHTPMIAATVWQMLEASQVGPSACLYLSVSLLLVHLLVLGCSWVISTETGTKLDTFCMLLVFTFQAPNGLGCCGITHRHMITPVWGNGIC